MGADDQISRRTFLLGSAGAMTGGLVLTYQLGTRLPPMVTGPTPLEAPRPGPLGTLNAYVHVRTDDTVVFTVPEIEVGQGIATALAQILADEMRARWDQLEVVFAPVDRALFGPQTTQDSSSIRRDTAGLRRMAAMARRMLLQEAAGVWGVRLPQCEVAEGQVHHRASKRSLSFGALAEGASRQRPPEDPLLLPTEQNTLVGRSVPRLGAEHHVSGAARYGLDVRRPGMKVAMVARAPWFGAQLERWDDAAARSVPAVVDVLRIPSGVAVVAEHTWAAEQGRQALDLVWSRPNGGSLDDDAVYDRLAARLKGADTVVSKGDLQSLGPAARSVQAEYRVPYLAHAALEPLNCTAHLRGDECELWVGTQNPAGALATAVRMTGLRPEQVRIHHPQVGGAFGRRMVTDYVEDAIHLSKALGRPVQVVWSREDDVTQGPHRPAALHRLRGVLDAEGWPVGWSHDIASSGAENGPGGRPAVSIPYAIPHQRIRFQNAPLAVPTGPWRSGEHSHLAFARECFLDELARVGGHDPLAVRRRLLALHPRHLAVLNAATQAAGYGGRLQDGRAHGMAVYESFGTVVAQVAEVSFAQRRLRVHKMTCAVDCGRSVNPDGVVAQMEGSIAFGLTAALFGRLRIRGSRVQESNFHDYRLLRLREMPVVTVKLVPSGSALGGAGEPGVPPVAPAVANALARLLGKPRRRLPLIT